MMQWMTLFQKETLENWRNYKWIWVPLTFVALMIIDPITNYYLPEILESFGGLPEGAVFDMPEPTAYEAIMMSLGQLSTLGIILIVLIFMGTITEERKSGVAEMVLTKPVTYVNYVTAKWFSSLLLVLISFFVGLGMTWYYINILYDTIPLLTILQVSLFYSCWLIFVVTLIVFFNTVFQSQGLVAFITIFTIIAINGITGLFSHKLTWSPSAISSHIQQLLVVDEIPTGLLGSSIIAILLTVILLILAIIILERKEIIDD